MGDDDLHYPNLSTCKLELSSSTVGTKPPVKLPPDVEGILSNLTIPKPYDFELGTFLHTTHSGHCGRSSLAVLTSTLLVVHFIL